MIVDVYLRIIGWGVKLVIGLPILANIINSGLCEFPTSCIHRCTVTELHWVLPT